MQHKLSEIAIYLLANNRNRFPVRQLHSFARKVVNGCLNLNYNCDLNGERLVLERLRPHGLKTFFDVGANRGEWTLMVRSVFPESAIHAFEIAPALYGAVDRCLGQLRPPVVVNPIGLLDREGSVTLNYCPDQDYVSSVVASPVPVRSEQLEVPVTTGDAYARRHELKSIDFLKIDVEGAEHLVLKGFGPMLKDGSIKVIQFEYGKGNIMTHFLLKDFYDLLEPLGYSIGKMYPNGVEFKPYSSFDENFIGPNFLAVHKRHPELLKAVR